MSRQTLITASLGSALVAASTFLWLSTSNFFGQPSEPLLLTAFALSLLLFLTFAASLGLIISSLRTVVVFFFTSALTVLFFFPPLWPTLAAGLVFFAALLLFTYRTGNAKNLYIRVDINRLLGPPLSLLFSLLAVVFSLLYYQAAAKTAEKFRLEVPDKIFNIAAKNLLSLAESQLQGEQQSWQTRELAEETFERQIPELRRALINQGITNPDELEREITKLKNRYLNEVQQKVRQELESPSGRNEKVLDYLKENVNAQLNTFVSRYRPYIPIVLASSFFFTFQFFGMIARSLSLLLTWLLFGVLKRFGFVRIETVTKEVETITI